MPLVGFENILRQVAVFKAHGDTIFGIQFTNKDYWLEQLARRPPVQDLWSVTILKNRMRTK